MGRVLYFDCFSGISGDMLIGACLDAGLPFEGLKAALGSLAVSGYELTARKVLRCGVSATKFDVTAGGVVIGTTVDADVVTEGSHSHSHAHSHAHESSHSQRHAHDHANSHEHRHDDGVPHSHAHTHDDGHTHEHRSLPAIRRPSSMRFPQAAVSCRLRATLHHES